MADSQPSHSSLIHRSLLPSHLVRFLDETSQSPVDLGKMREPDPVDVVARRIELDPVKPFVLTSPLQPQSHLDPVLPHDNACKPCSRLENDPCLLGVDGGRTDCPH